MTYRYEAERPWLFTEEGATELIRARDKILAAAKQNGCIRAGEAFKHMHAGDSWKNLAILDRLVELGDLVVVGHSARAAQHTLYEVPIGASR